MNEADEIYVLDTGSTDNTVKELEKYGVKVFQKKIKPWRFDEARNQSLSLVPDDVDLCVCTDLDEVFEKGWRKKMEDAFCNGVTRLSYRYTWSFNPDGSEGVVFYIDKAHKRQGYLWENPVHEVLVGKNEKIKLVNGVQLNHYADNTKSRAQYLPLLELAVREDPENDRNMHYLGREYMFYKKYDLAIFTLKKHLLLKSATWKDERCASMRFIARSYTALNRFDEARMWLDKAIKEAPHLRDPLIEKALLEYNQSNWNEVIKNCEDALKIDSKYKSYINEQFSWDHTVYDLLSIAYYNTNDFDKALINVNKAIDMKPNDEKLIRNKKIIEEKIN